MFNTRLSKTLSVKPAKKPETLRFIVAVEMHLDPIFNKAIILASIMSCGTIPSLQQLINSSWLATQVNHL